MTLRESGYMDIRNKDSRGEVKLTLIAAEANICTRMKLSTGEIRQVVALVETKNHLSGRRSNVSRMRVCSLEGCQ